MKNQNNKNAIITNWINTHKLRIHSFRSGTVFRFNFVHSKYSPKQEQFNGQYSALLLLFAELIGFITPHKAKIQKIINKRHLLKCLFLLQQVLYKIVILINFFSFCRKKICFSIHVLVLVLINLLF